MDLWSFHPMFYLFQGQLLKPSASSNLPNMTTLQSSGLLSLTSSSCRRSSSIRATLNIPKQNNLSFPKFNPRSLIDELNIRNGFATTTTTTQTSNSGRDSEEGATLLVTQELYAILESVSDRIEMHANIGEQRNNWNTLLLTSINAITISAATMTGLALIGSGTGSPVLALKLSSTLLYSAAAGMLLVMNKIQPSQLVEEQRNAVRLFKQLQGQIQTMISLRSATQMDVKNMTKKVLALDKAFPLPLLGGAMLEKFPTTVKPAVWWPQQEGNERKHSKQMVRDTNGWNEKLESEMRSIAGVLERKDGEEYVRLSKKVLNVNRVLANLGPSLTGVAAIGSALVGSSALGSWAAVFAILGGSLATVVNTMEHGGQIGMVFEMYRNCAGSFLLLQESIESALGETDMNKRENGEVFEMKVALQLGRSVSELRSLAELADTDSPHPFASKLL